MISAWATKKPRPPVEKVTYSMIRGSSLGAGWPCASSNRSGSDPSYVFNYFGFRLCWCVSEGVEIGEPDAPVISPESGTTFDSELTVNIYPVADATIHYTTDGTDPTIDSPVYKRFKIYAKTTVKAAAFNANGVGSEVTTAEYAMGRCADPVITPAGGVFQHSGQEVSIARTGTDGTLRYTLDGTEPTVLQGDGRHAVAGGSDRFFRIS